MDRFKITVRRSTNTEETVVDGWLAVTNIISQEAHLADLIQSIDIVRVVDGN